MISKILRLLLISIALIAPLHGVSAPLSVGMRKLCSQSDKKPFSPQLESILSPQTDSLYNSIEIGGGYEDTKRLLKNRKPDSIVINGITPMMLAALVGNWPAASALLESGANIDYSDPPAIELNPLAASLANSQFSMACKLIRSGALLPTASEDKKSFLRSTFSMKPESAGDGAIFIDFLLSNGFDVNDYGSKRQTPLMGAVSLHNIPVIKVLLKHGARLDVAKENGLTVWDTAKEKNNKTVIKLLKDAQKNISWKNRKLGR